MASAALSCGAVLRPMKQTLEDLTAQVAALRAEVCALKNAIYQSFPSNVAVGTCNTEICRMALRANTTGIGNTAVGGRYDR
jgi:hypothetical protein